jgi:dsDNA-specific endonuclease/ATPase MutS2
MPIDIPKHIRAEAQRAEFFIELVKQADRFNSLEQAMTDSLSSIDANRKAAEEILATATKTASAITEKARSMYDAAKEKLKSAYDEAESVLAKSNSEAAAVTKNADDALAAIHESHKNAAAKYEEQVVISEQIQSELDAAITVSQKKLDDINAAIAAIAGR